MIYRLHRLYSFFWDNTTQRITPYIHYSFILVYSLFKYYNSQLFANFWFLILTFFCYKLYLLIVLYTEHVIYYIIIVTLDLRFFFFFKHFLKIYTYKIRITRVILWWCNWMRSPDELVYYKNRNSNIADSILLISSYPFFPFSLCIVYFSGKLTIYSIWPSVVVTFHQSNTVAWYHNRYNFKCI